MSRTRPFVVHEEECELEPWGNALHGAVHTGTQLLRLLYLFPAASFDEIYEYPARGELAELVLEPRAA